MVPSEGHHYTLFGVDGEREPQLNNTVVGPKSGNVGCCYGNSGADDASDSDDMESMDEEGPDVDAVDEEFQPFVNLRGTYIVTGNTVYVVNEDGIYLCPSELADEVVITQALEDFDVDLDEGQRTPDYINHQTDMESSFESLEMLSRRSDSPGMMVWDGAQRWSDDVREGSGSHVWQLSETAMLASIADQTEQIEDDEYDADDNYE